MFCGSGEGKRTRFRKEKKGKRKKEKKKKLIAAKIVLDGIKEYFTTYNRAKYFLQCLMFLIKTAFYAELSGRFLGPKIKVA